MTGSADTRFLVNTFNLLFQTVLTFAAYNSKIMNDRTDVRKWITHNKCLQADIVYKQIMSAG